MNSENPVDTPLDAGSLRFGIVASRFHPDLVGELLDNVLNALRESDATSENIEIIRVPGSHEIPYAINALIESGEFDCLIALGVVIAGKTAHHDIIVHSTSHALQRISVEARLPVINGILLTGTRKEAAERCGKEINRGEQFARAAEEMARLHRQLLGSRKLNVSTGPEAFTKATEQLRAE